MVSIYVGNLPFRVTEDEVASLFSEFGEVQRVHLVMDRETGRPRGFGFVEMGDDEGRQAIQELMDRNAELGGRPLKLNEAQPREERGGGAPAAAVAAVVSRRWRWRRRLSRWRWRRWLPRRRS